MKKFAIVKPIINANVVTISKYTIVLSPILPKLLASSCPEIPTTKVAKSNGAIIIFTIRKKIVAKGRILTAKSGAKCPTTTPKTNAINIKAVSLECFNLGTSRILYMKHAAFKNPEQIC